MGTVNSCEQPKEGLIERGEIETNLDFEKSVNEKFIENYFNYHLCVVYSVCKPCTID